MRGELPPRRRPWFYDNGAFRDWQAGRDYNGVRWIRDQWRIRDRGLAPDFIVVPDLVAQGVESLAWSALHRRDVAEGSPAYLAVQDGMTPDDVRAALERSALDDLPYAGLFVGGTSAWKLATSATWRDLATALRLSLHVGRCGTPTKVRWARDLGADSIDSCLPLRHEEHLSRFLAACAA